MNEGIMMLDANAEVIDDEQEYNTRLERDIECVQAVLEGDIDRFSELVDRHGGLVFSIIARRVRGDDVETVAQDAFLRAFRSLDKYSRSKPFERWLTTITLRSCCDFWRKKEKERRIAVETPDLKDVEWFDAVVENWSGDIWSLEVKRDEISELIDYALGTLKPKDRMVIELTYFDGLTMKEAARELGWSVANVKIRAMRARLKMRRTLSKILK